ncbi:MAG: SsrA-binding protein SmpB [Coriobacteriales bacterium]|nr:SsrA-binding protein SmpB [Coriobacteriales bacterium]
MAKTSSHDESDVRLIAKNRRASFDYEIKERFEAGISLTGTEVRSLRDGGGSLAEAFVLIRKGQATLRGLHIKPYINGSYNNGDPDRSRVLLLHKKQIRYLDEQTAQKGMTIIPLRIYFKGSLVKAEIALARGKKHWDKRQSMAERDAKREIERAIKDRRNLGY